MGEPAAEPFEVTYRTTGRARTRHVVGVLCPTALAQLLFGARPIFVDMGDVRVDWTAPQSAGYVTMFEMSADRTTQGKG